MMRREREGLRIGPEREESALGLASRCSLPRMAGLTSLFPLSVYHEIIQQTALDSAASDKGRMRSLARLTLVIAPGPDSLSDTSWRGRWRSE